MNDYVIEIELLSESIFGNGEASTSFVDVDVLKDEYGIPFIKGRTFKGKLREEAESIASILFAGSENKCVSELFGSSSCADGSVLRFSDCTISQKVKNNLIYGIQPNRIKHSEIIDSLTEVRSFTQLDGDGIAKEGSLRQARVIKKGLKLYCNVSAVRELTSVEEGILACGIKTLNNIGMMESRGKGHIICRLRKENKDITLKCINKLEKELI